jgi:hypothetical protein
LISTCGRIINRESWLFGVAGFLRPDKLEFRSIDVEREPDRIALEIDGDRAEGEETFDAVFFTPLALLSNVEELNLLAEDEEETDNAGLRDGFLTGSCLGTSGRVDLLKLRLTVTGDTGVDFLVSEMLGLDKDFVVAEGNELLSSGRDFLTGSETGGLETLFPPTTLLPTLFCLFVLDTDDFSDNPPVLFLLITGTGFEVREEALRVDFIKLEIESEPFWSSIFLRVEPVDDAAIFAADAIVGFIVLGTFFTLSDELTENCFSEICSFSSSSSQV